MSTTGFPRKSDRFTVPPFPSYTVKSGASWGSGAWVPSPDGAALSGGWVFPPSWLCSAPRLSCPYST